MSVGGEWARHTNKVKTPISIAVLNKRHVGLSSCQTVRRSHGPAVLLALILKNRALVQTDRKSKKDIKKFHARTINNISSHHHIITSS